MGKLNKAGTIGDEDWRDLQDRAHKARRFELGSPEDIRRTIRGAGTAWMRRRGARTDVTGEQDGRMTNYYNENNGELIADLLVGRRIVEAEKGSYDYPGRNSWDDHAEGRMVLDDGTTLYLTGNVGGCSCSAGDYPLEKIAAVDNIITSARVECDPTGDFADDWQRDGAYRIFVVADAVEINVAEFVGSDGNGYYGTGFALHVVRPVP